MRWSPLRITELWAKFLYVVVWVVGGFVLVLALRPAGIIETILRLVVQTTAIYIGVRSFRGEGEPALPPRRWWRATSRPTAGFVLAGLFGLGALNWVVPASFQLGSVTTSGVSGFPWGLLHSIVMFVWNLAIGVFYLNSSAILRAQPASTKWISRDRTPDF